MQARGKAMAYIGLRWRTFRQRTEEILIEAPSVVRYG